MDTMNGTNKTSNTGDGPDLQEDHLELEGEGTFEEGLPGHAAGSPDTNQDQDAHILDASLSSGESEVAAEETGDISQIGQAQETIKALEEELSQTKDKMLRAVAEGENIRRRAEKERTDASKYAVSNFAKSLLSVADNFRRALESVPEDMTQGNESLANLLSGIQAIERELLSSFDKAGIEKITPQGQLFDPNYHEVMFEVEAAEQEPGTIMQVIEPGYMINGRLLRPARVGVAKGGSEQSQKFDTVA